MDDALSCAGTNCQAIIGVDKFTLNPLLNAKYTTNQIYETGFRLSG